MGAKGEINLFTLVSQSTVKCHLGSKARTSWDKTRLTQINDGQSQNNSMFY